MKKSYSLPILIAFLLTLAISSALAAPKAAQAPVFLPGDDPVGPAAYNQMEPAISLGGNQYLVAWTDYRTGGNHLIIDESGADIFAARLDAAGNLIDTTPILLTMAAGDDTEPKIAWNGQNWLVVWLSQTPTEFFWSTEVQAVRVSPSGQVLDPEPITVYKFDTSQGSEADVASDGMDWVVVMQGPSGDDPGILASRIAADGTVLNSGVAMVPGNFSMTFHVHVAFATNEYLLTYLHQGKVLGLRFGPNLQLIDSAPFTIAAPSVEAQYPHVASNGAGFFVLWGEWNNGPQTGEARGTRVNLAGQVLDPGGLAITGLVSLGIYDPRITWNGTNWIATYKRTNFGGDPDILLASRITAAGQVLDVGGQNIEPVTTGYTEPDLAPAVGGGSRLVWQDNRAGGATPNDISTFSLSTNLVPGAPSVVSFSAPAQTQPDVATSGNGYMLAFRSSVSGEHRIKIHPLDVQGNPLLAGPIQLDNGVTLSDPAVAWNGSLYFVVWSEVGTPNLNDSIVWGQRVNPNGTLIDSSPFQLMEGFTPDVSALGDVFLAVAIQQTLTSEIREPFGIRVQGSTGQILDSSPIDLGFSFARLPAVASMGGKWLATYHRNFSHDDPNAEIRATFIEANGTTSESFLVASSLNPFLYNPDIASDGTDALILWENAQLPNPFIQGARVLNNGTVASIFTLNNAPNAQDFPAIAWDGGQYVTLYQDLRNITFFIDERSDIFGTRVSANGTLIDPNGFPVYPSPFPDTDPAVAGANGVSLLAAAIFRAETPFQNYRIGYSLLEGDPPPTMTPTPTTPSGTASPTPTATSQAGRNTPTPTATLPGGTASPTPTPTATSQSGRNTPTPTATSPGETPTAPPTATTTSQPPANTGLLNPSANAPVTSQSGDNNGFELNPANGQANDALFAVDNNSGNSTSTSCAHRGKDRHLYYNYNIPLPAGAVVNGIEVRLDALVDSTAGAPFMCVELSWDGGLSWTTVKTTASLTTSEGMYLLGSQTDQWGRTWQPGELGNVNFRLRITNVASSLDRDFSLDWAAVNVYYQVP